MGKGKFFRGEISHCEWVKICSRWVVRVSFWLMNKDLCKKALFSGIELICEFLRTMLNHNQFLLSIVFYFIFLPICRVCRSFKFERKIWRVQVANLHSGARALSCPSRCHKLDKIFFRHLLRWDAATDLANALRLLQSRVFLQQSKILHWEINYTRSLETSNNTEIKKYQSLLFGLVKESATVTLLIISAVFPYFQLNF